MQDTFQQQIAGSFLSRRNVDFIFVRMCEMNTVHDLLTPESVACNVKTQDSLKGRVITAHSYSSSLSLGTVS